MQKNNDDAGRKPAVLILDWADCSRSLTVRTLSPLDVSILESNNGLEGMELLKNHPEIALVIMDLIIPGLDGVDFFHRLREFNDSLPFILMIAYEPEDTAERLGANLPDLVIIKPYRPKHLLEAATGLIDYYESSRS